MGPALIALAAFQVVKGFHDAETLRAQGEVTKSINELNAKYAEQDQFNAETYGATEVASYDPQVTKTVANQRTAMAAADVDVSYGTAKDIQDETKLTGQLNMLDIQNQAHAKALGYKRQASNIRIQGAMGQLATDSAASSAQASGIASGAGTAIRAYERY